MRKRILSILLTLCMALTLLPVTALAEDTNVTKLTSISGDLGSGVYQLDADVTITTTLNITGDTTLDLNDRVLQMTGSGSVFKIENGGHLTLEDNAATKTLKYFSKNNATDPWTLLTDSSTSAYSVSGGVITGGSAQRGGGVLIEDGGTLTMNGGSIVGCAATHTSLAAWGGGVFVLNGQFNMTGGNIVGCTAVTQGGDVAHGGGVCISRGTFNMSGGSITDCTAAAQGADGAAWGGGICNYSNGITTLSGTAKIQNCHATGNKCYGGGICDSGKLNISGNVQIIGCTAGGQGSDAMYINANKGSSVTGGTFYGGISGSGTISGHIVTYQVNGADYATQVVPSGETATAPTLTVPAGQTFSGWYKADGTEWNFTNDTVTESLTLTGWLYAPVTNENGLTTALADNSIDVIRLMNDINITSTVEIKSGRQVTLDLNDHVLKMIGSGRVFEVYSKSCLTLEDNAAKKTTKYFDRDESTGLWTLRTSGTSNYSVSGGVITGGSTASDHSGGAIYVYSSSTAIMNGGSIVGCSAGVGGGAVRINGAKFEMNSGAIIGCTANDNGGGVANGGTFTMTGGSISDCTAGNGDAICLRRGTMNANGGTVDGTVVLEGGSIQGSGTSATEFNGVVTNGNMISHGTFNGTVENTGTLTGGTFNGAVNNTGTITGGVFNNTVSGSGTITGGTFNPLITGSGTKNDPYQIGTADQLKLFRDIVNGAGGQTQNRGACAVLTAVIDLNNEPWTPIGNYTEENKIYYEGTFDGGGHTISGLNVTGDFRCASLFGAVKGGTIKNLTVAGNVSHNYNSTGLDCHVGGIVGGALDAATIENCSNNCSVTGGSGDFIGGIAGSNIDNARIIDCYNVGTITGTISGTGGVTGLNMGTISNCYNVGTIKTLYNSDAVGEIVGNNSGTVENCYYLAGRYEPERSWQKRE